MSARNPPRDAESQAAPFHTLAVAGITSEKRLENTRQNFGRDAVPGVRNLQFGAIASSPQRQDHSPFWLIVFDGVVREVEQQLTQAVAIARDGCLVAHFQLYLDAVRPGEALAVGGRFSNQFIQTHRLARECYLARVGLGQQRQAIHNLGQSLDLVELAFQSLALRCCKRALPQRSF